MGLFGDLFDFNNDGKLDAFEKAAEFGAFMQMVDSEEQDEEENEDEVELRNSICSQKKCGAVIF